MNAVFTAPSVIQNILNLLYFFSEDFLNDFTCGFQSKYIDSFFVMTYLAAAVGWRSSLTVIVMLKLTAAPAFGAEMIGSLNVLKSHPHLDTTYCRGCKKGQTTDVFLSLFFLLNSYY